MPLKRNRKRSVSPANRTAVHLGSAASWPIEALERRLMLSVGQPQLVRDINADTRSSDPAQLIDVGGTLYFTAFDGVSGIELWKSDGTAVGTVLVKDINPGPAGSSPNNLTAFGGRLYFSATDGVGGVELWASDGTEAGTVRVKDINPGPADSSPGGLTEIGGTLYFSASDPAGGSELWKSDGTAAGTVRVKDIVPGTGGSGPSNLTAVGSTLYFTASVATFGPIPTGIGTELWKSDGTEAGTVLVKDIVPGFGSSYLSGLTAVGGTLFFSATVWDAGGTELWKSDGTAAGTVLVKDIVADSTSSYPSSLTAVGGALYFAADDGTGDRELWTSDGTEAGTVLVKDINPGPGGSHPGNLTAVGGILYFSPYYGGLWKSDGTEAGTVLVKAIGTGPLAVVEGILYLSASDGAGGWELWRSDGTEGGTALVKDIVAGPGGSYPANLTAAGGTLYFSAFDATGGRELWTSDGTDAGTVRVKDINSAGSYPSDPGSMLAAGSTLYFTASDSSSGRELWKTDGTEAGTIRVRDVNPGAGNSDPRFLTAADGVIYFDANDGVSGGELWKTDGTEAGTLRVKDINPGPSGSDPSYLTAVGGTLYFAAFSDAGGWDLWKSDGTEQGTVLVKDLFPGSYGSFLMNFTAVGGTLYFSASNDAVGWQLWKSDGTEAGTALVTDLDGPWWTATAVGGTLYFSLALDDASGWELWKTDGTEAGLVLVKDINPGPGGSYPRTLTAMDGTLYFTANDGVNGDELWKSDGTETGTVRVTDINPGPGNSGLYNLTPAGGTLYFIASDGSANVPYIGAGSGLWKSDGTEAGTVLVKDISGGVDGAFLWELMAVGGTLFFNAFDGANDYGLWTSDGTEAGTTRLTGINDAEGRTAAGAHWLFYTSDDGIHGRELWKLYANRSPAGGDDAATTSAEAAVAGNVLANDTDADGDALTAVLVSGPAHGTLALDGDGSFVYTPHAGYHGTDSFTYKANDGGADSNETTVTLTVTPIEAATSSLSGIVWLDASNDGQVDFGETGIPGVSVHLSGTDDLGQPVSRTLVTDADGAFVFLNLRPGTYSITEDQPDGYLDGIDSLGTAGGLSASDAFSQIVLGANQDGFNYNFGERPLATTPVQPGQAAGIGFWQNQRGQSLIKGLNGGPAATYLAHWLAATFPNLFGAAAGENDLTGKTNEQVAAVYQQKFKLKGIKLDAQVMATALAVYVTNSSLAGNAATAYGFTVNEIGLGNASFNVGQSGAAFGVSDGTTMRVIDILLATDARALNGMLYSGDDLLRRLANEVFDGMNSMGQIG